MSQLVGGGHERRELAIVDLPTAQCSKVLRRMNALLFCELRDSPVLPELFDRNSQLWSWWSDGTDEDARRLTARGIITNFPGEHIWLPQHALDVIG